MENILKAPSYLKNYLSVGSPTIANIIKLEYGQNTFISKINAGHNFKIFYSLDIEFNEPGGLLVLQFENGERIVLFDCEKHGYDGMKNVYDNYVEDRLNLQELQLTCFGFKELYICLQYDTDIDDIVVENLENYFAFFSVFLVCDNKLVSEIYVYECS